MPSAPRDVSRFVLPLVSHIQGIEAPFPGPEQRPLRSSGRVIGRCEGLGPAAPLVLSHQLLEASVVDPGEPVAIDLELGGKGTCYRAGENGEDEISHSC